MDKIKTSRKLERFENQVHQIKDEIIEELLTPEFYKENHTELFGIVRGAEELTRAISDLNTKITDTLAESTIKELR